MVFSLEEITQFNIPTGVPILYELDEKCKSQSSEIPW